ncbi:MAG: helix-turn-helix transcriptional regulator [Planctomycetota bacterium]
MENEVVYFVDERLMRGRWGMLPMDAPWRRQPMGMIWRCSGGRVRVCADQQEWELESGDALTIRRHRVASLEILSGPVFCQRVLYHCQSQPRLPPVLRRPDPLLFDCCFARLTRIFQQQGGRSDSAAVWLRALLDGLVTDHLGDGEAQPDRVNALRSWCAAIDADPAADWSVARMAAQEGISSDHFTRLFKQVALVSPRDYIVRARIHAASSRLRDGSEPIARIAAALGYGSVYHFSHQFRRHVGESPTSYRRRMRGVGESQS